MKTTGKKRIIVSVTTDLVSDNRVRRTCTTLVETGFDVLLVGRKLPESLPLSPRAYFARRLNLIFRRGPLFYACFNLRLFFFLIFNKFDVLLANDLDSLPANFLASKLKNKPLVYDSHEFFTEVPELVNRPKVKRFWEKLERKMVPAVDSAYTVCDSIAKIYTEKYGIHFRVVRNVPSFREAHINKKPAQGNGEPVIIYQGALNIGRGLEQAIKAMKFLKNARLLVAGDGDIREELEELTKREGLSDKVQFLGRLTIGRLAEVTPQASLGLSIEEDLGLNYRYALPNKLFDYIQARVPVLVTNLPEMAAIVEKYQVGRVAESLEPRALASVFSEMLTDEIARDRWKQNLEHAAVELTWENEKKILQEIFQVYL